MIGNSRLHWAWFVGATLTQAWDMSHLPGSVVEQLTQPSESGVIPKEILPPLLASVYSSEARSQLPLYLASVVSTQTQLWKTFPAVKEITLAHLPLSQLYPSLGIDRALAVLGAGETFGYPVLVIDAGTALTFTGADSDRQLIGGAILPGLGLQLQSLARNTAALPTIQLPPQLPQRWAMETPTAIESGVIYTVLAGIRDFIENWWCQFPGSAITLTGGDSSLVLTYLQAQFPEMARQLMTDPHLIFWGIRSVIKEVEG